MKTIFKTLILTALAAVLAFPQTTVPSTTLCAAVTATQTSVCLASTTSVVNQTGLYVDNEYMLVNLANNQTLGATNAMVPVLRGRAGNGPPSLHNSGQTVWIALTSALSVNPGTNGFIMGTQLGDVGPCTRSTVTYLPHFWPDRGVVRDCNAALGYWVDAVTGPIGQYTSAPMGEPIILSGASYTVSAHQAAVYVMTYAGAEAITLGAPTAGVDDFKVITFIGGSAYAHVITSTGNLLTGTTSKTGVLTFSAVAGSSCQLMAYQGKWILLSNQTVTLTS